MLADLSTGQPTEIPAMNTLLADLTGRMADVLGDRLLGVYLYGSLVWGDFDIATSDIDLLAVLAGPINAQTLSALEAMHARCAHDHPAWNDRIEVQYAPQQGLPDFRTQPFAMANISPGEPIHIVEAGIEWLTNWYFVQDYGVTLLGPSPDRYIGTITSDEFLAAIYEHAMHWRTWVETTRDNAPYQSYAILTLCRALYTLTFGTQVSKQRAAQWAIEALPHEAPLIRAALHTRVTASVSSLDSAATYGETVRFVRSVADLIEALWKQEPP